MKFKQYMNEGIMTTKKWEELKAILDKDCKYYISHLKLGAKYLLIRGVKSMPSFYDKKNIRTDRKPRVIDLDLHKKLGTYSKEKFGWNIRTEGLFTSINKLDTKLWGKPSIVFPIGNFKYVVNSNVEELYNEYDSWTYDNDPYRAWTRIQGHVDNYSTDGLPRYLMYGSGYTSECIIKTKSYYSINYEWYQTLLSYYNGSINK